MDRRFDLAFARQVGAALLVMTFVAAWPLARLGNPEVIRAVAIGAAMSTVNVLLGYAAIAGSINRSSTTFLKVVLGGMGVRMLVMLLSLVVLIKVFHVHAASLTASLLGSYAVFLTLEVLYIQKKIGSQHGRPTT